MTGEGSLHDDTGLIRIGSKRSRDDSSTERQGLHDGQQSKRTRVTRACDQCRATRERCDGVKPECGTCVSQNRSCTWKEVPKKRGIQPNYIRTLELTLAWLFQYRPECEGQLASSLPVTDGLTHKLIAAKDAASAETLHQSWRNSIVSKQIDQLLSGATVEVGHSHELTHRRSTSDGYLGIPATPRLDDLISSGNINGGRGSGGSGGKGQSSNVLMLPDNAWMLLEYYFAFTHCWLPFVGKHEILKSMYSFPTSGMSFEDAKAAEHCELFSILALSATQMRDEQHSSLQESAKRLVPDQQRNPTIASASAMLVLAIIDLNAGASLGAWLNLGTVLRLISFPHPMHKASASTLWDRYKRIRLAAAILEKALAANLRTVPQDSLYPLDESSLLSEEGDEEWEPWKDPTAGPNSASFKAPVRSCSTFNNLLRLMPSTSHSFGVESAEKASNFSGLVFSLLQNSSNVSKRRQPSEIVAEHVSKHPPPRLLSQSYPGTLKSSIPVATIEAESAEQVPPTSSYRTMSHQHSNSGLSNSATVPAPPNMPDLLTRDMPVGKHNSVGSWQSSNPDIALPMPTSGQELPQTSHDNLFEELALLEGAEVSNQDDEFLRNLGFGPELDLAEFFGSDYQPSDPFMAYMQPSMLGTPQNGRLPTVDPG